MANVVKCPECQADFSFEWIKRNLPGIAKKPKCPLCETELKYTPMFSVPTILFRLFYGGIIPLLITIVSSDYGLTISTLIDSSILFCAVLIVLSIVLFHIVMSTEACIVRKYGNLTIRDK